MSTYNVDAYNVSTPLLADQKQFEKPKYILLTKYIRMKYCDNFFWQDPLVECGISPQPSVRQQSRRNSSIRPFNSIQVKEMDALG